VKLQIIHAKANVSNNNNEIIMKPNQVYSAA